MPHLVEAALDDRRLGVATSTPSASSTSAEPHCATTARGCRAWRRARPHAATTSAASVEMLNVPRAVAAGAAGVDADAGRARAAAARARASRVAAPTSSSTVSPFMRSATSSAADLRRRSPAPSMIVPDRPRPSRRATGPRARSARCDARARSRRSSPRQLAGSCASSALPSVGQDRLGMELHALDAAASCGAAPMISSSRGLRRDLERVGQRLAARRRASGSASPTNGFATPANSPLLVVDDRRGLAVHDRAARARPCRRTPGRCLMAEAHAEDRHLARERADHVDRDAGLVRRARAGRDHDRARARARAIVVDA